MTAPVALSSRLRGGRFAALALGTTVLLGACAPDLGPRPEPTPLSAYQTRQSFAAPAAAWPSDAWWTVYHDPQLTGLIDEALKGAPDIRIAEARLRLAQAQAEQAGAATLPELSGNGSVQETRQSINQGFPDVYKPLLPHGWHTTPRTTLDFSYEFDFFGKNRAALAAATSQAEAAAADEAEARLMLSTAVAGAYADFVRLSADGKTAADAVRVRQQSADLVNQRVVNGLETRGQLAEAEAQVAIAQTQQDAVDGAIARARNEIAALLGKGPDRGLKLAPPEAVTLTPFGLPRSLPADLVGRRPDIVAARLRAEAAAHQIDVAHAAFYPNIDLEGSFGLQSLDLADFANHGSIIGAFGPALHLPLFEGGKLTGAYRGARAGYDEAVASYDQTVTHALQDVANAVVNARELQRELAHAREALKDSEVAWNVAELRYKGGLSPYLDVLTAEGTLLTQRQTVADLEAQNFAQNIALVRALGGGYLEPALASN